MPRVTTSTDAFLTEISGKLDQLIGLLEPPKVRVDMEPPAAPVDDAPATGEPEKKLAAKKSPAKKATTRKRVTGQ